TSSTITLGQSDVGDTISVTLTYIDDQSETNTITLTAASDVDNVNDAPSATTAIADASTAEDAAYSLDASTGFTDEDGDAMTFTMSGAPSTLSMSTAGLITGTPVNADVGTHTIVVTASDSVDTGTDTYVLTVTNTNDAPTISSTAVTAATEDVAYSYTVVGADDDGDTLTMVGTTVPSWMTFDTSTGALTGTPGDAEIGDHSVVITVSDASESVTDTFTIAVANVNDAPAGSTICTAQSTPTLTVTVTSSSADGTFTIGSDQTAEIVVTTDNYPSEGAMSVGGQSYTWGSGGTTVSLTAAGSYTLTLTDSWGDGGHTATVTLSDCATTY
ncbi:uncharacterized protein METZ01_LOCUS340269, partial [marine metagenome]